MQIIQNNFKPDITQPPPSHYQICPHCHSEFRYSDSDIRQYYNTADSPDDDFYYISCPCCSKQINLGDGIWQQTCKCERCNKEYFPDKYIGAYGLIYARCPHCNNENMFDESIELTSENIEYPKHFNSYEKGAFISDKEINKWIKKSVEMLDKDVDCAYTSSGNALVIAFKNDESMHTAQIIVTKKYQESEITIPIEKY